MQGVTEVRAVPGRGLEGDRYFYKKPKQTPRDLTLIAAEALEAFAAEAATELTPAESRRNVLTRGVPLNDLVGQEFAVGPVRVRGVELCEPCGHLRRLTGKPVLPGMVGRGGLRCAILTEGRIAVGDPVAPAC